MLRYGLALLLILFSNAYAGILNVAEISGPDYYISISDENGSCGASSGVCITYYKIPKKDNKNDVKVHSFPFSSECYLTKSGKKIKPDTNGYGGEFDRDYDGFACPSKGRTPLAGATYKLIQFGRSSNACEESDVLGNKFICVKGCNNPVVPEYLNGSDGTC